MNGQQQQGPPFTHADITYVLPVPHITVHALKLMQTFNEHVIMEITVVVPESLKPEDIEAVPENARAEINLPGLSTPYFSGVCTNVRLRDEGGFKLVTIQALSWTYLLDIVEVSRSYQHMGITYEQLLADILKDYPQAMYIVELPPDRRYDALIIQYQETAWSLLKRLAAREHTVLTPEYADANHNPRFWLGLPQTQPIELNANFGQCLQRDNQHYLTLAANIFSQVQPADFLTYQTTGYTTMHLGQAVTYHGKNLFVVRIDSRLEQELLTHTYTLAPNVHMALQDTGENTKLKGCSLPGKVLERSGVHIKVHLDIDQSQDKATARWFPYSADADSFMYCMPQEGETVNLYHPNSKETDAIAISAARRNGQTCDKTGDYNNRYFTTNEGKEMYLSPDTLSLTSDESAANKIAIVMNDDSGINIVSAKNLKLNSDNDIQIKGKTVTLWAGAGGSGANMPGLYLNTGLASIIMQEDVTNISGKPVRLDGTNKAPCPKLDNYPADEDDADDPDDDLTAEDVEDLLEVPLGFVPVAGDAIALKDFDEAMEKGDYKGAFIASLGLIPEVEGVSKVIKILRKGKIGRKLLKALFKLWRRVRKLRKLANSKLGRGITNSKTLAVEEEKAAKAAADRVGKGKADKLYDRSSFRKSARAKAESEAPKSTSGKMLCPTCGKEIPDSIIVNTTNGPVKRIGYDLDHYPDTWAERVEKMKTGEVKPTRAEVLDEYNSHLRVQCHECNISHKYEGVEGTYKGEIQE